MRQENVEGGAVTDAERIVELTTQLRERDTDPVFANAAILDAYSRISKNEETGETEKTDRQLVDVLRGMVRDGYRLGRILRDDNMSAWKRNRKRKDWEILLKRLDAKESHGVYTWHIDRLLRQPFDLEVLIETADRGVTVASAYGMYDIRNSDHRMILRVLVAAACKASDDTSRRGRRKNEARRAAGIMDKGECFGHGSAPSVEAEREFIAWAIQSVVDDAKTWTWGRLASEANRRKLTSRNGHPFNALKVRTVLNRPRHAGLLSYEDKIVGRLADAEKAAIVSEELWQSFQTVLATRKRGRPEATERYPLSGLVVCECGCSMIGTSQAGYKGNGRIRAYRCGAHGCNRNYVNAEALECWAEGATLKILSDPKAGRTIARASAALGKVDAKLKALREREEIIAAKLSDLRNDVGPLIDAVTSIRTQIEQATAERKALAEEAGTGTGPRDYAELSAEYQASDADGRRTFLAQAFPRGHRIMVARDRTAAERFTRQ